MPDFNSQSKTDLLTRKQKDNGMDILSDALKNKEKSNDHQDIIRLDKDLS